MKTERELPDIMTPEEVAKWLKVDPRNLKRLGVPSMKLGYRTVRFVRQDVEKWLKQWRNLR